MAKRIEEMEQNIKEAEIMALIDSKELAEAQVKQVKGWKKKIKKSGNK